MPPRQSDTSVRRVQRNGNPEPYFGACRYFRSVGLDRPLGGFIALRSAVEGQKKSIAKGLDVRRCLESPRFQHVLANDVLPEA